MRALFFHAAAKRASVVLPLMDQTSQVLRPVRRFLDQAIQTAKERQFRYQLPWERVRNVRTVRLEALDTRLRVPRQPPGVVLPDWPADKPFDFGQMGFVRNRSVQVRFEGATPTSAGLLVRTDVPLLPADHVIWCDVESSVRPQAAEPAPRDVTDLQGRRLRLAAPPTADGDGRHWILIVEGVVEDCDVVADGVEAAAEALPPLEVLSRVVDCADRAFDVSGGILRVEEAPATGPLRGDDGVRYRGTVAPSGGRSGCWIQLLPLPTAEADGFLDPRAAFCEGDVEEVWTQPRYSKETVFRVKKVDQDRYQLLLDRYPPDGSTLFLPVDVRNLYLQQRALRQLAEGPLPHHQGLLRLCEDPRHASWPIVAPAVIPDDGWRSLTDLSRDGTEEQRRFVAKALGSTDFAFLEGPPGSGKTTAICELIQQLVEKGERVLLCASTHVAIDNVLERLLESTSPIDAVRIGRIEKVDEKVLATQLDERVNALVTAWCRQDGLAAHGDGKLKEMAERAVIMAANLTCGTTMGIVNHPLFRGRDEDLHPADRPITTLPHWDVLIVDEASKTLIQEFLVPALLAKRWVVVGDVHQLPPFSDRAGIVANLRDLVDEQERPLFLADHQRAILLLFRMLRHELRQPGIRWLIVEPPGVLEWIARELEAEPERDLSVARVVAKTVATSSAVDVVTVTQLRAGEPFALRVAAADWVLVGDDLIGEVAPFLPSNLLTAEVLAGPRRLLAEGSVLFKRQEWWHERSGSLSKPYKDKDFQRQKEVSQIARFAHVQECESDWLQDHDWANEIAWRLTRFHELRNSGNEEQRRRLRGAIDRLRPRAADISEPLAEIEEIGLPSILEVLQEGIGESRSKLRGALTAGLKATRPADFEARFESLSFQHRMHCQIADFPREVIYRGKSLRDANTIERRDEELSWNFESLQFRRVWAHVEGREQDGVNRDEIAVMAALLREFIAWAQAKGRPARSRPAIWEVACLCFYGKQEGAISDMLREVTQDDRRTRFEVRDVPIEVVCGTVDRFQGREADLVMLSMRNTRRHGFLDSPNRLNVGVTRARQQLVIIGNYDYFSGCSISELEALAARSGRVDWLELRRSRKGVR